MPCLVDGPMPVRIISPPKKEVTCHAKSLPTKWIKHPTETTADGSVLQPCLEVEFDIVSNKTLRSVSSMLRRYIQCIACDLALIVEKPLPNDKDEPSACLALWRFDRIDIDSCPALPSRNQDSADSTTESNKNAKLRADVKRASEIVNLSQAELATIRERAE